MTHLTPAETEPERPASAPGRRPGHMIRAAGAGESSRRPHARPAHRLMELPMTRLPSHPAETVAQASLVAETSRLSNDRVALVCWAARTRPGAGALAGHKSRIVLFLVKCCLLLDLDCLQLALWFIFQANRKNRKQI